MFVIKENIPSFYDAKFATFEEVRAYLKGRLWNIPCWGYSTNEQGQDIVMCEGKLFAIILEN